jgi:hypothetical protein
MPQTKTRRLLPQALAQAQALALALALAVLSLSRCHHRLSQG